MSFITTVSANKTLGEDDDAAIQAVNGAYTITIPADSTYDFPIGDVIFVLSITISTVSIAGEMGVTIRAKATDIKTQNGLATLIKVDSDEWVVYGDLE